MKCPISCMFVKRFSGLRSLVFLASLLVLTSVASGQKKNNKQAAKTAKAEVVVPQWIGLQPDAAAPKVYLRKEIEIRGLATSVRLYAVCDQPMMVYVDGQKVLDNSRAALDPGWQISRLQGCDRSLRDDSAGGESCRRRGDCRRRQRSTRRSC